MANRLGTNDPIYDASRLRSAGRGGIDFSNLDQTYLRLDATNDPVTGDLDIKVDDVNALRVLTSADAQVFRADTVNNLIEGRLNEYWVQETKYLVVDAAGRGDYTNLTDALSYITANGANDDRWSIIVRSDLTENIASWSAGVAKADLNVHVWSLGKTRINGWVQGGSYGILHFHNFRIYNTDNGTNATFRASNGNSIYAYDCDLIREEAIPIGPQGIVVDPSGGSVYLYRCKIEQVTAAEYPTIRFVNAGYVYAWDCEIIANVSTTRGAVTSNIGGSLYLYHCKISNIGTGDDIAINALDGSVNVWRCQYDTTKVDGTGSITILDGDVPASYASVPNGTAEGQVLQTGASPYTAQWSTNTLTISGNSTINGSFTGITAKSVNRVVCVGDSLSLSTAYPVQLAALLDSAVWQVVGNGIAGISAVQLAPYILRASTASDHYAVVFVGINGIISGDSAATTEAALQSMYTALKTAGRTVVAVEVTPWKANAGWTAGKQTVTDDVNTWINSTAINVDYIIPAYAALENTPGDDLLKAAYDSGDGLHPNTAGKAALAAAVFAGATWTPVAVNPTVTTNGVNISLNQSLATSDSPNFMNLTIADTLTLGIQGLIASRIRPPSDSVTAIEVYNAATTGTPVMTFDTTNKRVGILNQAPTVALDVIGNFRMGQASGPSTMTIAAANGSSPNFILSQAGWVSWFVANPASTQSLLFYNGSNSNVMTLGINGNIGVGVTPSTRLHVLNTTTTANAVLEVARLEARVSTAATGSAAGFGASQNFYGESATDASYRLMASVNTVWTDATDATRTSRANIETTGPGKCAAWGYSGIAGTALTIIANGTGDVTEGITVQYVASEVTGTDSFGGVVYLEPSDSFNICTDGTNTLTLTCAADGSVTIARSAGTDTFKFTCWVVWQ